MIVDSPPLALLTRLRWSRGIALYCALFSLAGGGCGDGPGTGEPAPGTHWARVFGGIGEEHGQALAVGPGGELVLAGFLGSNTDLGDGLLSVPGKEGAFLAKYRVGDGQAQWTARYAGPNYAEALAAAVDSGGDILLTGFFGGSVDFGTGTLHSGSVGLNATDIFLARYAKDGTCRWARRMGGPSLQRALSVAVSPAGEVVIAGFFADTADLGTGPLKSAGSTDAFVAGYAFADGQPRWAQRFGGAGRDSATALGLLGEDVVVTGFFSGSGDFSGQALTAAGGADVFVTRYRPREGRALWTRGAGGPHDDIANALAVDGTFAVTIAGSFADVADFGGDPLTSAGDSDIFLSRYAAEDGSPLWSRSFGGPDADAATGLAVQGDELLLCGFFTTQVDLGGGLLDSAGSTDVFVSGHAAADGAHRWSSRFGGSSGDYALGIASTGAGGVAVTGAFGGVIDFGGGPLSSHGRGDIFLLDLVR